MRSKVIVDGRNSYHPQKLQAERWSYYSVGTIQYITTEQIMVEISEILKNDT